MDNIEDILRVLAEDDEETKSENCDGCENCGECSDKTEQPCDGADSGGLFSGLDPQMLLSLLAAFETLNQPDDNERFLLALKPLLREENRRKVDSAIRLMKLFSLLPLIRDSGIFGELMS